MPITETASPASPIHHDYAQTMSPFAGELCSGWYVMRLRQAGETA